MGSGLGASTASTNTKSSLGQGTGLASSIQGTGLGSATTGSGVESSTTESATSRTGGHHNGRDAALAGGASAAAVGAYEASRGGPAPKTAGPHKSDMMNKLDPRVDSDLSKQQGISGSNMGTNSSGQRTSGMESKTTTTGPASGVTGTTSQGTTLPSDTPISSSTTSRNNHFGQSVGVASAGAAGLGMSEAEKHHRGEQASNTTPTTSADPYSTSSVHPRVHSTDHPTTSAIAGSTDTGAAEYRTGGTGTSGSHGALGTSKDHHYGRNAGIVGAGGLAAYEGEKHLGGKGDPTQSSVEPKSTTYGTPGQVLHDSGSGPTTSTRDRGATPGQILHESEREHRTSTRDQGLSGTEHHLGRDAGIAGAGGPAAYEAEEHIGRKQKPIDNHGFEHQGHFEPAKSTVEPTERNYGRDAAMGAGGVGSGAAAYETEKRHDSEPPVGTTPGYTDQAAAPPKSRTGRDAALAGGAGAGAGAFAEHEMSKDDMKAREKEIAKEQKAHDKEIAKENKAHDKQVAKEHKAHDKDVKKAEKQHEKEVEKAEKKHEKELGKEERKEEKKHHGGILGLFKR